MKSIKRLTRSFRHSFRGVVHIFQSEQNFRIQSTVAFLVIILAFFFQIRAWEKIILILASMTVLVLELVNTVIERVIDVLKPRMHGYVRDVKDMMAATVLISSIGALVIGILIFWPYVFGK